MKAQRILFAALAVALTACDDYNDKFDGLDDLVDEGQVNVISGLTYELQDDDYTTIGAYAPTDNADSIQLVYVKKNKTFPSDAIAQKYLPKFAASKWQTADIGSAVTITYKLATSASEDLSRLAAANSYELSADDYATIWKGESTAKYLTKSTESRIASILPAAIEGAQAGDYVLVTYKYSETEPSASTDKPVCHWTKLSGATYPEGKNWNYVSTGKIDLSEYVGQVVRIGFRYLSTSSLAGTIELKNLKVADASITKYVAPQLFAEHEDGSYKKASSFGGAGKYILLAEVDGSYYSFGKIKDGKAYGYCVSDPITVTDDAVAAADAENILLNVEESANGYSIKNSDGLYFYMKGTYDSFNTASAIGDDSGFDWTFNVTADGVEVVNVAVGKTITYDSSYSSYGAYNNAKLGIYEKNTLLSDELPEGYLTKDVELPDAASYIWALTAKYGAKASAFINKTNYESESWFVTKEIDLSETTSPYLSVECAANFFNGNSVEDYLQICVTSDYEEKADFVVNGNKSLKAADNSETKYAIYSYDGTSWAIPDAILVVNPADYKAMGITSNSFSSSYKPETYLANFLATKLPYAIEGDKAAVVYYYDSNIEVAEYEFAGGAWVAPAAYELRKGQFVKSSSWIYDPCVTITLSSDRSDAATKAFYQTVTDWVWDNVDVPNGATTKGQGYVTSYANNEYYTGSSAYYNNVDWRASKAKEQSSDFANMTDEEVFEQMQKNLIDTYGKVLANLYPDANVVEGVDVIYTINFVAYYSKENNGSNSNVNYTIKYKCIGKASFEYVADSLQEVE